MAHALTASLDQLLQDFPLEQSMPTLVAPVPVEGALGARVAELAEQLPACLAAGLWILADDIQRAHVLVQDDEGGSGAAWHAIIHRREGDFWNSQYWWRKVGSHPAVHHQHGRNLVQQVEALRQGETPPELLAAQRSEWKSLFAHCREEAGI